VQVRVRRDSNIPPLAWLCQTDGRRYAFTIGTGLEVTDRFIFEGVWDGPFTSDPSRTEFAFGSGATLGSQIVFVPPKHSLEFLFVLHDKTRALTYVSNSLSYCFRAARITTADALFGAIESELFDKTNEATARGVDLYVPLVAEDTRFRVQRFIFYNFTIGEHGSIRPCPMPPRSYFRDYRSYVAFMHETLRRLFANGQDPQRKRPLMPVTSISKGYDSPAVAALAHDAGCRQAVTLKVSVAGLDDSGADIAAAIGLPVNEFAHCIGTHILTLRSGFADDLRRRVLEFIATAGAGDDVGFEPFENQLSSAIFLTGAFGDSAWERNSTLPPGIPVRVVFGKSITEFRLRVGFAHVPVPFIGARLPWLLRNISQSEEMRPFALRDDYDRPIPRRIVEEKGVGRGMFGLLKNATAPLALNHRELFRSAMELVMQRYDGSFSHGVTTDDAASEDHPA
jgi:hypothetical protein